MGRLFYIQFLVLYITVFVSSVGALNFSTDTSLIAASEGAPFWLRSNRWGTVSEESFQASLGVSVEHMFRPSDSLRIEFKGDVLARGKVDPDLIIREAYGDISWSFLSLKGGVFQEPIGLLPEPELSSGSMSVSGNAPPLHKIRFASDGFFPVPFTDNNLWLMGGISHGWFNGERTVEDSLLHEKWAYMKLKREEIFSFHLGLVHQVVWGGVSENVDIPPVNWENFWRVFFSRSGGEDSPEGWQINKFGDTLGIWDIGAEIGFDTFTLNLYKHHFFEDGSGLKYANYKDGLRGITLSLQNNEILEKIAVEFLHTTHQSGEYHDTSQIHDEISTDERVILGGRDGYYHHSVYSSGWTHQGMVLGNPFFLTSGEGEALRISGNRIIALHTGVKGNLNPHIEYLLKTSFARYYEPYTTSAAEKITESDKNPLDQWSHYIELKYPNVFGVNDLTGTFGVALDHGDVYPFTIGTMLSLLKKY